MQDNGLGIPADDVPRIFGLGAQVERNKARSDGGLGIGLALVRKVAEMHGGTVEAFSDGPGHGCEFVIRLRLATETPRSTSDQRRASMTVERPGGAADAR